MSDYRGKLLVVGIGPGAREQMTRRAEAAIAEADTVVGYKTYLNLLGDLGPGKTVIASGMTEEVIRVQQAVDLAEEGRRVAVVSSGDPGVYGMAGLVFEILRERGWDPAAGLEVEVVPGTTAANSCAALVGAPLMHDYATISLSDHLTPWEVIARRVAAAAGADFVIALYNPSATRRKEPLAATRATITRHRPGTTPVALVHEAYRLGQRVVITDLDHLLDHPAGMLATVIVGNSQTFVYKGFMVTPRGYAGKYRLEKGDAGQ
ncbi:MAG: precorrin-3B C(17)-methyltransferase [Bacillota bacterium]